MQQSAVTTRRTEPFTLLGPAELSLFDRLVPSATAWHKSSAVVLGIILVSLLAQARFFLPDNPVPITLQGFGVLMLGGILGWRLGLVSAIGYYFGGLAGLPVFANGGEGWDYVIHGVTGGYLLGFILAVGVVGYLSQRGWNRGRSLWPMLIGSLLIYVPALIWLSVFDFSWPAEGKLFSAALYPFLPGDILKLMAAAALTGGLWRLADRRR
ncbi:MAG: biotin transporter BioY [Dehalococcoidia bacterium]|jgi:biotin transport system substrate-specific component|nr:biotin transporter BioY [Chloroflexota bacterium]MDP6056624.1 biotin transporter BioY [Dehalococcoidia bacterium]MDP7261362.1 biotin transporter BioY [Dehalococcoidia bacterium]MDP7485611.1 biotin transporter BioY [Dehalococcoidia bacterium]|tara:strand:+ start:155 stop:787 length:633 start_codon:yes stop_codon:yes gene_type:complete